MKTPAKILVVDDVPRNVKLLADLLTAIRTQLKRRLIPSWVEIGLKVPAKTPFSSPLTHTARLF